jgi:hypothetical protein
MSRWEMMMPSDASCRRSPFHANAADLGHDPLDLDRGRGVVQGLPMVSALDEFVADLCSFHDARAAA